MREYATRYGLKFNIKEQLGEGRSCEFLRDTESTMLTQNRGISDSIRTNARLMTTSMTTTSALRRAKANDWGCHAVNAFG